MNDKLSGCQIKKLRSLDVFAGCGGKQVSVFLPVGQILVISIKYIKHGNDKR